MKTLAAAMCLVATTGLAQDFAARFETIKREASQDELYRILYAVPKGGDLHNHLGGSAFDDVLFELATDESVNGNQTFRTRVRINECAVDCGTPLTYFHTVGEARWSAMPTCCQEEYEPLNELSTQKRGEWLSATRIDTDREGRNEFFETIWPRLDDVLNDREVGRRGRHLPRDRRADDQRQRDDAEQADHGGQGDRERRVAPRQVGHQVRGDAARAGRDQHRAHRQRRGHRPKPDQCQTDQGKQDHLAERAHQKIARLCRDPLEIRYRERQPQREHDEGERNRQQNLGDEVGFRHGAPRRVCWCYCGRNRLFAPAKLRRRAQEKIP